jgi:hypothetical protein
MDRRQFVSAMPVAVGTWSIAIAEAYAQTASASDTSAASDEVTIASIVTGERWARDMAQWDVMQAATILEPRWISPGSQALLRNSWRNRNSTMNGEPDHFTCLDRYWSK